MMTNGETMKYEITLIRAPREDQPRQEVTFVDRTPARFSGEAARRLFEAEAAINELTPFRVHIFVSESE